MAGLMDKIVSLAKRRGFVYPGSEIYGGLANTYDYGPLGAELLRNIKNLWWKYFVTSRKDIYGLHTGIIMNPKVWEAAGHTKNFTDTLVDCRKCKNRTRADHLIENYFAKKGKRIKVEGYSMEELEKLIIEKKIHCSDCGSFNWTSPRKFNILFETKIGIVPESQSLAYLRGEIAQGMFVNFKQVLGSLFPKLPFGLAQSGAAFRNEITMGNFIFRTLQFNLSEIEYFYNPKNQDWNKLFKKWKEEVYKFAIKELGLTGGKLRWREHTDQERAHYAKHTEDLDFEFSFGYKELFAVAYRTDFDLRNHMEKTGTDLRYTDAKTGRKFIPHVIEPTFGMDRAFLSVLQDGYFEENIKGNKRVVLKLKPALSPYKAAVFPLLANKPVLVDKAKKIFNKLKRNFNTAWDDRGNIGKRYFSQDEIGTPYCATVDFDTLKDSKVTIRDRDTTRQKRVAIGRIVEYINSKLKT